MEHASWPWVASYRSICIDTQTEDWTIHDLHCDDMPMQDHDYGTSCHMGST